MEGTPEGAAPAAEATPAGTPAVETPAAAPAAAPAADPFDTPEVETFDRKYVTGLREENAKHRTAVKRYEEAFKGWTPEDQDVWLETVGLASQSPAVAADRLRQIADLLHKGATVEQAVEQVAEGAAAEEPKFLTQAELDAQLAEREQNRLVEQHVVAIKKQAAELGYEEGTAAYHNLLWRATNETGNDLAKAHEAIEAERQAVIDAYVAAKAAEAEANPLGAGAGGAHVSGAVEHDGTFATARARTEARLRAMKDAAL